MYIMFRGNALEFANKKESKVQPENGIETFLLDENWKGGPDAENIRKITKAGQEVSFDKDAKNEDGIISGINDKPKYSSNFYDCVGIAACGESLSNNKPISFLAHLSRSTGYFKEKDKGYYNPDKISKDLQKQTSELLKSSKEKTVSIAIFGGFVNRNTENKNDRIVGNFHSYVNTINFLRESFSVFKDLDPVIVIGPKRYMDLNNGTEAYFDTPQRKLFIYQKGNDAKPNFRPFSFKLSEADKFLKEIEKEFEN